MWNAEDIAEGAARHAVIPDPAPVPVCTDNPDTYFAREVLLEHLRVDGHEENAEYIKLVMGLDSQNNSTQPQRRTVATESMSKNLRTQLITNFM